MLYTGHPFSFGIIQAQIITILFVTLMYAGATPILYPLCFIYLILIYLYSKFFIVKYCSISYDVSENFILGTYRVLVLALIAHFLISLHLFRQSDAFTNDLEFGVNETKDVQWSMKLYKFFTAYQNVERNKQEVQIVELYFDFCIFALTFYLVNLFFMNPMTVCCKAMKPKNASENYDTGNTSSYSFKAQNWLMGIEESPIVPSNDYYAEVSLSALRYQYSCTIEDILEANSRLELYFRIAKINEES